MITHEQGAQKQLPSMPSGKRKDAAFNCYHLLSLCTLLSRFYTIRPNLLIYHLRGRRNGNFRLSVACLQYLGRGTVPLKTETSHLHRLLVKDSYNLGA